MHFQWKLFGFRQEYIRRGNENYLLVRDTFQLDLLWIKYWRQKFSLNWSNENLDLGQSFFDKFVKNSLYLTKSHFARKHFYLFTFLHATFSWLGTRIFFDIVFSIVFYLTKTTFANFFRNVFFYQLPFFGFWMKFFSNLSKNVSAKLSKLRSTCPKDHFERIFLEKIFTHPRNASPWRNFFPTWFFYCLRRAW